MCFDIFIHSFIHSFIHNLWISTNLTILLIYISASIIGHNCQINDNNIEKSVRFGNYIEFLIRWRQPHRSSSIRLEMTGKIRLLPHGENGENFSFRNPSFLAPCCHRQTSHILYWWCAAVTINGTGRQTVLRFAWKLTRHELYWTT